MSVSQVWESLSAGIDAEVTRPGQERLRIPAHGFRVLEISLSNVCVNLSGLFSPIPENHDSSKRTRAVTWLACTGRMHRKPVFRRFLHKTSGLSKRYFERTETVYESPVRKPEYDSYAFLFCQDSRTRNRILQSSPNDERLLSVI